MTALDPGQRSTVGYRTIVADPPWVQDRGPAFGGRANDTRTAREVGTTTATTSGALSYPTLSVAQISALPVAGFSAADAHLYLWVTNRYVTDGPVIARAWGFEPITLLTWCKPPMGMGLGGAFVQTTEHVWFCRRGREVRTARADSSWWQWRRPSEGRARKHSAKPDAFFDVVESVSPAPRLELFARRRRLGWDAWGNEVDSDIDMAA